MLLELMKANIHPNTYRPVIFEDATSGQRFLFGSTIRAEEKDTWDDGKEYDKVTVEISSASHPFYTGKETTIDTAGRVDKFRKRQAAASKGGK